MPDIVVMFFVLGLVAGIARSDLVIPRAAYDTMSLLLMLTIGLKGGMALHGNLAWELVPELLAIMALGALIPLLLMPVLRFWVNLSAADSASLAAHYGSVSAGTFAVALAYVQSAGLAMGPQVTLYLVLLELPAIMVSIAIYRRHQGAGAKGAVRRLWHETLTNRGVVLLVGGALIGVLYGPVQGAPVTDLFTGAFHAVLALFLLEMGLTAAEVLRPFPWKLWRLLLFAAVAPFGLGLLGLLLGTLLGLPEGSVLMLAALTASASYIAAPAAIRTAIPDANIGLAMFAALGLTFPINVLLGIPVFHAIAGWMAG